MADICYVAGKGQGGGKGEGVWRGVIRPCIGRQCHVCVLRHRMKMNYTNTF